MFSQSKPTQESEKLQEVNLETCRKWFPGFTVLIATGGKVIVIKHLRKEVTAGLAEALSVPLSLGIEPDSKTKPIIKPITQSTRDDRYGIHLTNDDITCIQNHITATHHSDFIISADSLNPGNLVTKTKCETFFPGYSVRMFMDRSEKVGQINYMIEHKNEACVQYLSDKLAASNPPIKGRNGAKFVLKQNGIFGIVLVDQNVKDFETISDRPNTRISAADGESYVRKEIPVAQKRYSRPAGYKG